MNKKRFVINHNTLRLPIIFHQRRSSLSMLWDVTIGRRYEGCLPVLYAYEFQNSHDGLTVSITEGDINRYMIHYNDKLILESGPEFADLEIVGRKGESLKAHSWYLVKQILIAIYKHRKYYNIQDPINLEYDNKTKRLTIDSAKGNSSYRVAIHSII